VWKEVVVAYYPRVWLEILRETTKNLSQDCLCAGRDSNRAPAEVNSDDLPLKPVPP
jgi:hypothetical protein